MVSGGTLKKLTPRREDPQPRGNILTLRLCALTILIQGSMESRPTHIRTERSVWFAALAYFAVKQSVAALRADDSLLNPPDQFPFSATIGERARVRCRSLAAFRQFMLPNPQDRPPAAPQGPVHQLITRDVGGKFPPPKRPVAFGLGSSAKRSFNIRHHDIVDPIGN
jgi:hypothetical protein